LLVRHGGALDLVIEHAELVFQFLYFFRKRSVNRTSRDAPTPGIMIE
jgi:hypothetical protein